VILEETSSDEHLLPCSELLEKYSIQMRNQKMCNQIDEVRHVQPLSRNLIRDLFKVIIPDQYNDLVFVFGEKPNTKYHTSIQLDANEWVDVSGKSDISVYYLNVCIFVWEDNRLDSILNTPKEKCQITVEVKGFAEDFKSSIGVEAPRFCGVETSGLVWSFCTRYFRNGNNHSSCIFSQEYRIYSLSFTFVNASTVCTYTYIYMRFHLQNQLCIILSVHG
jgi:hypothetical protein